MQDQSAAGLVDDRAEGTRRVYFIDPRGLGPLSEWLGQFWDQSLTTFPVEVEREGARKGKGREMNRTITVAGTPMKELVHEAMSGPSAWSVADRELMAAFVSKVNDCEFCIKAHGAVAGRAYRDGIGTIPETAETENTRSYQGGIWLGDLDSNQDRRSQNPY
jgi:AhpD family alkylhydroperoxidase